MTKNLPSTFVQREKYPLLPDNVFVPIESPIVPEEISGRYGINKKGDIKNLESGKLMSKVKDDYGYVHLSTTFRINGKPHTVKYLIHRLVASVFLYNPAPEECNVVNHINHDRSNNNINNLEWVTSFENWRAEKVSLRNEKFLGVYIAYDKEGNEVERFYRRDCPDKYVMASVEAAACKGNTYKGLIWKLNKPKKIISGFSGDINDYEWFKHWKYENVYVCREGFVRVGEKITYYSDKRNTVGYVFVSIKHKTYPAHRIIMEYILNRDLEEGEVIDHINRDRTDNRFDNLRVCSNKENMNNINTIKYLSNTIIVCNLLGDIIIKTHTKDAYEFIYGKKDKQHSNYSNPLLAANLCKKTYICFIEGDYISLLKKMNFVYYVFDKDKSKILKVFTRLKTMYNDELFSEVSERIVYSGFKTGKLIGEKYYIYSGIEAAKILKSIGHLNSVEIDLNETDLKET